MSRGTMEATRLQMEQQGRARRFLGSWLSRPAGRGSRGQSLVEFALVFPIFLLLLFGIIEFAFVFNAQLSLNYATRDAALIAAEAGNNAKPRTA